MRLYRSIIACVIKPSNILPCKLEQMDLLYPGLLLNQSWWLVSFISYSISRLELIIHDIPTWCNIAFNTNLVTISSYTPVKLVSESKPVYLLQLVRLIDKTPNSLFPRLKRISNMANIFNNDDIIPLFFCILCSVCSIMGSAHA